MTISDAGNIQEMRVWVMRPKPSIPQIDPPSFTFGWNFNDLVENKRLIVTRHANLPGAMGSADFKLLRNTIDDNDPKLRHPFTWDETKLPIVPGAYIFVTAGLLSEVAPAGVLNVSRVVWFGFIDQIDGDQLAGTSELIGNVSALEVGHLLDRIQARGWKRSGTDPDAAVTISTPESANIGGKVDGQIIGNAVLSTDGSSKPLYIFQSDPAKCSAIPAAYFTRWRLFKHFVSQCLGFSSGILNGVTWSVACFDGSAGDDPSGNTISGYLNSTTIPEVFKIRNQTCKGILDLLIPRPFSFGWTINLVSGTSPTTAIWQIGVYTLSESTTYGLPSFAAYAQNIDLGSLPIVSWHRHTSSIDVPDEIIVEGNQIIFGVTAGYADLNINSGWTSTQETAYRAGASGDSGYASLTNSEKLDRNRSIRNSPSISDVFTRYTLLAAKGTLELRRKLEQPGIGQGADLPMCPQIKWDGTNIIFEHGKSRAPYLPTATLARGLPWIEGFLSTGTDRRPPYLIPWPVFAKPKLFYYDSSQSAGKQWVDLLARGGNRSCPGLDVDDRGAAVKVTFDAPERMGYGTIQQGVDAIYDTGTAVSAFPWVEGVDGFDWKKVVFTIGVPSDQRMSVTLLRPGVVNATDIRNSLKITDEKYNFWVMHGGSILSILADGTPDRVRGFDDKNSVIVRNDFPALIAHANRVASFTFRRRRGFVYTGLRPDLAWTSIGFAIGTVTDGASTAYNTVVERIECTYGDHPRLVIEADLPPAPGLSGHGAPATGGPVAVTLNGTVSQAVQQVAQDVKKLQADGQRTPLVMPYNPGGGSTAAPELYIAIGNNIIPACTSLGIQKRTDAVLGSELPIGTGGVSGDIVLVPAVTSPPVMPNGVGVGKQYGTGNLIWLLLDSNSSYVSDIPNQKNIVGGGIINLDKVNAGITYRYPCHIVYRAW